MKVIVEFVAMCSARIASTGIGLPLGSPGVLAAARGGAIVRSPTSPALLWRASGNNAISITEQAMMEAIPAAVVEKEVEAGMAVEAPAARPRLDGDFGRPGGSRPAHQV